MDLWSTASASYVLLRTLAAVWLLVLMARRSAGTADLAGQAFSDAAAALFLLAYARYDVREMLGWLAVPLLIYFVGWEVVAAVRRFELVGDSPGEVTSEAEIIGAGFVWTWDIFGIAPAIFAGAFVVLDVVAPRQWNFPNAPPAFTCAPAVLAAGETLTLDLAVPHGGELIVLRPRKEPLYLVEAAPAGFVPPEQRFDFRDRVMLRADSAVGRAAYGARSEPVFADTGEYIFTVPEYKDPSVVFTCRVRYLGPRAKNDGS
ncbi:MAG TPA: hypothetical protein VGA20_03085 [Gemmatimonadales bacterium]